MSDNWVVQNLQEALSTWNGKMAEVWKLLTIYPQSFKGGGIWQVIININGAVQAIGLALLVLFFLTGVARTGASLSEVKRPEHALKLFLRFAIAKGVVTYGLELMMSLFYPGVQERIAGVFGEGYSVLPCSVHELIIIPDSAGVDRESMAAMVRDANRTVVEPKEVLSDNVHRTVSIGLSDRVFIKETLKTESGIREVPISDYAFPVIREALRAMRDNPLGLIFSKPTGNTIIRTNEVSTFYKRSCEKIGIEYNGQHALRHTFATRCIEAGVPPVVLKAWLGHKNIHVTLDTYADVFERMNLDAINLFSGYLNRLEEEGAMQLTGRSEE